jgi:hypothetical protein
MYAANADGEKTPSGGEALLAPYRHKSGSSKGCPDPRLDRAAEVIDETGEMLLVPIGCGRNSCPVCRRRNVMVTASMHGLNALDSPTPPTYAVLTTTRDWVDEATLREGWAQFARRVRREVCPGCGYAWFREFTQRDETADWRRTHYHSLWTHLQDDEQAQAVAEISLDVWARLAGANSDKAHGSQRVYDAGGLARYIAGLVGHHLKPGQAPPPGWSGRRTGTSRGYYATDATELRKRAKEAARDRALTYRLMLDLLDSAPDGLPDVIVDETVTYRLELAKAKPKAKIVRLPRGWTW